MDEGLWHIRRAERVVAGERLRRGGGREPDPRDVLRAVLDMPSDAAPGISRWPAVQREDAERRRPPCVPQGISHAEPYPVLAWPRGAFWLAAGLCAAAPALAGLMRKRRAADFAALMVRRGDAEITPPPLRADTEYRIARRRSGKIPRSARRSRGRRLRLDWRTPTPRCPTSGRWPTPTRRRARSSSCAPARRMPSANPRSGCSGGCRAEPDSAAPEARRAGRRGRGVLQHEGVDFDELQRAMELGFVRGASTITQQLAKNLYLSPSRNPVRKFRELIITRRLEAELKRRASSRST